MLGDILLAFSLVVLMIMMGSMGASCLYICKPHDPEAGPFLASWVSDLCGGEKGLVWRSANAANCDQRTSPATKPSRRYPSIELADWMIIRAEAHKREQVSRANHHIVGNPPMDVDGCM